MKKFLEELPKLKWIQREKQRSREAEKHRNRERKKGRKGEKEIYMYNMYIYRCMFCACV